MSGLADQLYGLYRAEIYAVLAANDPEYQRSLANAGLGWNVRTLPAVQRTAFEQEMKMQAFLGARRIEEARSLETATIRAKVLTGPITLYRVSQRGSKAPIGIWWFTEKVAQRCSAEVGGDGQSNWNGCGTSSLYASTGATSTRLNASRFTVMRESRR